jgi:hypothetical protein
MRPSWGRILLTAGLKADNLWGDNGGSLRHTDTGPAERAQGKG